MAPDDEGLCPLIATEGLYESMAMERDRRVAGRASEWSTTSRGAVVILLKKWQVTSLLHSANEEFGRFGFGVKERRGRFGNERCGGVAGWGCKCGGTERVGMRAASSSAHADSPETAEVGAKRMQCKSHGIDEIKEHPRPRGSQAGGGSRVIYSWPESSSRPSLVRRGRPGRQPASLVR